MGSGLSATRSTLGRLARAVREHVAVRHRSGEAQVQIDDLISPLRYDILIRERFFEWLLAEPEGAAADPETLARRARGLEYGAWFESVVVPRFMPALVGERKRIDAAFAARVAKSVELRRSFEEHGYDRGRPITLHTGREVLPTATGKRLARRLHAGDGCHRLALLRARGQQTLEAGDYRLRIERRYEPLDNTAMLIGALGIDRRAYWDFMALSYGDLVAADRSGPEPGAEATELGPEMLAVAALDEPLLTADPRLGRP